MTPFFSIIIPLYNKENEILDTLKSVLSQTFQDFEIIIVNDGSTDKSLEKVKTLINSKIKIFSTKNQGVSAARNYGISKSTSSLIVFLDSDDFWYNFHLTNLHQLQISL